MWGPTDKIPEALYFNGAPYAPFSKGDKLGKVADWASDPAKEAKDQKRAQGRGFRDPYHAYGASTSSFFTADDGDSSWSFSVVDSFSRNNGPGSSFGGNKTNGPGNGPGGRTAVLRARGSGRQQSNSGPGRSVSNAAVSSAHAAAASNAPQSRGPQTSRGPRTMTIGSATLHSRRGGGRQQPWMNDKSRSRKPSVPIGSDWKLIQINSFSEFQKLSFDVGESKELGKYGYVKMFDRSMDKLLQARRLRRVDVTEYNVSTSEDPVIRKLAAAPLDEDNATKVYATDGIIALLMCSPKSNDPWDVIVTKKDRRIFFDKRDNSTIDLPPVDENATVPPAEVTDNKVDSASALALEASYINLNFEANVVLSGSENKTEFENPNPFSSDDEPESAPLLPKGYIYKEFNLEPNPEADPITLVIRMEVDAAVDRHGEKELANVYALNEYGGTRPLEWKERFSSHRGAIVAAEMKKNLNKLSQWTTRTLLAELPVMKIGFVSRINAKDNQSHEIVAVLTQNPDNFASQLNLNMLNGWGLIKSLVTVFASLDDGKYVLLRDPNAPAVSIYNVPENTTFDEN